MSRPLSAAYADSKPHYELLDGLRGVAALLVVFYHIFEGFSFAAGGAPITVINHGYLAVDFLSLGNFFKRRLIRLHPMIVLGAVLGAVSYALQGCEQWDGTHVAASMIMLALLCALFFIPAAPGAAYDVRGNAEMFPLNGPSWSLFFEYIGNLLYALFVHRLSDRALLALVVLSGAGLAWFVLFDPVGYGMIGVGWTLDGLNFVGGLLRMLFPYTLGLLLSRHFRPVRARGAFWTCSAVLLVLFCVPFVPGRGVVTYNGLFEFGCIFIVFPLLVWLAASGQTTDRRSRAVCKFSGDISYPLYAVHYPVMYLFYAWLIRTGQHTFAETSPVALGVYAGSVLLAYAALRLYDEPVRRWLARRVLPRRK